MKAKKSQVIEEVLRYMESRFGIQRDVLADYELVEFKDVWITSKDVAKFKTKAIRRKGMRFARVFKRGYKLTTSAIQVFGRYATKNVVRLMKKEEVIDYIKGLNLKLGEEERAGAQDGQVIVKFNDDLIGSGLLREDILKNQIPKGRRINVRF